MDVNVNLEEAKKLLSVPESCLRKMEGELTVLVHPMHSGNLKQGVLEELTALIKRYSKQLQGIPMAYEKIQLLSSNGWLFDTNPFNHVVVRAMFYVFTPQIGSILEATVKKKSINHVGCLVHGMFNVSVPRPQDTPADNWCGTYVQEGDVVKLTITDLNLTSYIPYIKGELDPDRVQELVDARRLEEEQKAQASKKITFDEDSGISSNEHEESVVPDVKKKKKKKKSNGDDQNNSLMNDSVDETEVDGTDKSPKKANKKDSHEEEDERVATDTPKRKKKKQNQEDEEATNTDLVNDSETKEKKKKKKHKKVKSDDEEVKPEEETEEIDVLDSLLDKSIASISNDTPKRKRKRDKEDEEEAANVNLLSDSEIKEAKKKKNKKRIESSDVDVALKEDTSENVLSDLNDTPQRRRKKKKADVEEAVNLTILNSDNEIKVEKKKLEKNKHGAIESKEEKAEIGLDHILDGLMKDMASSDALKPRKSKKRKADEDLDSSRSGKRKKIAK